MNFNKRTSTEDLYQLLKDLNIKDAIVIRKHQLSNILKHKKYKNIIMNLDDFNNGTHWVALNTDKKLYFDSYAQLPPLNVPKNYKMASDHIELQDIEGTNCGALCALWLYYINKKNNKSFYKLFIDVY